VIVIGIADAIRKFSDLLNQVAYSGETLVLTSHDRPKAIVISLVVLQAISRGEYPDDATKYLIATGKLSDDLVPSKNKPSNP